MSFEVIDRMVRDANPVPDPSVLDDLGVVPMRMQRKTRRGPLMAAAAAVVVAVVAVSVVLATSSGSKRSIAPAGSGAESLHVGFIGLPPEGAVPSTPATGTLVVSLWTHQSEGDPSWGNGSVYVYEDGRVIWTRRDGDPDPHGANASTTGFLEQRLSPKGVELVRAALPMEFLGVDQVPQPIDLGVGPVLTVQVPAGDRLVRADLGPDPAQRSALMELAGKLRTLDAWLPADAWKDQTVRAYVPSRVAVDVVPATVGQVPADDQGVRAVLPPAAQAVLEGIEAMHYTAPPGAWGPDNAGVPDRYRFELSLAQATELAKILEADRVTRPDFAAYHLGFEVGGLGFVFRDILPDGVTDCACF